MRKPFIAGNWKMNKNLEDSCRLAEELVEKCVDYKDCSIVIAPVCVNLYPVYQIIKESNISLSGQNLYWQEQGAYT
jgi:triosephosphate isomerase